MFKLLIIAVVIVVLIGVRVGFVYFSSDVQINLVSGTAHILDWQDKTTVETRQGTVNGLSNGRVHAFLGLRYALPPTGERRFLPPLPSGPWQGTYEATSFPNIAMQTDTAPLEDLSLSEMSEDALFLNIFTPATDDNNKPVLFWIHGGGFTQGSANGYDGSVLAEQGDVVVVAVNYRLGIFGFLDLSRFGEEFAGSASNGIRDQILALQWVRDNIADYGGDAGNVTIFGESAGGQSVLSILASPSADDLYHKAIVHSGAATNRAPEDFSEALAKHLKVAIADVPESLTDLTAEELFAVQQAVSIGGGGSVDGVVTTRSSNEAILDRGADGVPLIAGSNLNEGTLFSFLIPRFVYGILGDAIGAAVVPDVPVAQYLADMKAAYPNDSRKEHFERIWLELLTRGGLNAAARASAAGPGGWLYRFDMPVQRGFDVELGATHAAEIPFTFNIFAGDAPDDAMFHHRRDPNVTQLAQNWSNTILQFAKTGNPNGAGLPDWPRYTAETRKTMILDAKPRLETFLHSADRKRWGDNEQTSADYYR